MNKREAWDAVDAKGNLLGFDLYRDEKDKIPEGVYCRAVEIVTVTCDKKVLLTQRDPRKKFGLKWEFTGGSVIKGETPLAGAVRELREETGIHAAPENLVLMLEMIRGHELCYFYVHTIPDSHVQVTLQEGETVGYKFVPVSELKEAVQDESFAAPIAETFSAFEAELFSYISTME